MSAPLMTDEQLYTVKEIAAILRVHEQTVRQLIKDGELAAFKVRSEYRIRQSALDEFMRGKGKTSQNGKP